MAPNMKRPSRSELLKKTYQCRIDDALACDNPLLRLSSSELAEYESTSGQSFRIKFVRSHDASDDVLGWILNLTKVNMMHHYRDSEWGWNESQKEKEMKNEKALFLIIEETKSQEKAGFVHFRFDWDEDGALGVIYCYELQIVDKYRCQGIGRYMVRVLKELAVQFKFPKLMLTCLKNNPRAIKFYREKCNFIIDPSSPSKFNENKCYEILSCKVTLER
ncbi:N-alpha-acetyltransferase 40 [Brevipalpus obovatus]|uniref:N-alpha-acetyltransferase 40 n=1 Tax=Brevipalpus obovatus TaxID=246614 RepID=UPI003D9F739E